MSWQAALAAYTTEGLDPILKFWFGKTTGSRDERRVRVAEVLGDRAEVARAIAGWPADLHRGLAAAFRLGGGDAEQLVAHLAGTGVENAADVVMTLLQRGVLLPAVGVQNQAWAFRQSIPLELVPAAAAHARSPAVLPLAVATVPDVAVVVKERSDGEALVPALADILALAGRGKIHMLTSGLPGKPAISAARKAAAPYPGVDGALLLHAALGCELLFNDGPGPATPAPPQERPPHPDQILQHLVFGLTHGGWWVDDHGTTDDGELTAVLRFAGENTPDPLELCDARAVLLGIVRRMPSGAWVTVDALVDEALRLLPQVAFRRTNAETSYYTGGRPASASERRIQRNTLMAILFRTFFSLGLTDIGSTTAGPLPLLGRPPYSHALDRQHRDRHASTHSLPPWSPAPSPLVVRRSALADRLLGDADTTPTAAPGSVHIGADFSVTAPRDGLPSGLRAALDRLAVALPVGPGDDVRRWRFDRERWVAAAQAGVDAAAMVSELERLAACPLPPEVATTTRSWTASFGDVVAYVEHDLVEWPDAKARERALKKLPDARLVGERFAIVPAGTVRGSVIDGAAPPPRSLCTDDEGCVFPVSGIDLVGQTLLDRYAPPAADGVRCLDRAAVAAGDLDTVTAAFELRLAAPMARGFMARLVAWSGELGTASAATVEVVQFASLHHASLALALPEIAACVEGSLGNGVVVVRPGQLATLRKALADLGVKLKSGLAFEG